MNKDKLIKLLKIVWSLCSVFVLLKTLLVHQSTPSPEATLGGLIAMSVLSAPLSLLTLVLMNISAMLVAILFSGAIPDNNFVIITSWLFLFVSGYYQWFVLVPRFYGWVKRLKREKK